MTWGKRPEHGATRLHFLLLPSWCEEAEVWAWFEPVLQVYHRASPDRWVTMKPAGAAR